MVFRSSLFLGLCLLAVALVRADDTPGDLFPGASGASTLPAAPTHQPQPPRDQPSDTMTAASQPVAPPTVTPSEAPSDQPTQQPAVPEVPVAQPKSIAAKNAEIKFHADMRKLDADYQLKANAIKQSYIDNLKTILRTLAKSENADPDEIAKLSAKIKRDQAIQIGAGQRQEDKDQITEISGKWQAHWNVGTSSEGSAVRILKNDKTLSCEGNGTGIWLRDGDMVVLIFDSCFEKLVLSKNRRAMAGFSTAGGHTFISYSYLEK
jgi:hypothetical protein